VTVKEMKDRWLGVAGRFSKSGAAYRLQQEEEALAWQKEAAAAIPPPPPDPREVLVSAWIASNPDAFKALCSLVDGMIQTSAVSRREAVSSHSFMAFHEGETASLENLLRKLKELSGQA